jgi:outer membrane protein OmpA-like peptidoglycan-associated protein/outer membrane biosynthesis protein TonB
MPNRKAILAAATFLSFLSVVPAVEAQNERTLTEAPAQTGPVSITFDRAEAKYAIGEVVGLFIQSTENSYVTVLNVSPNGSVVKLFPNKYQTDALVGAGKRVQVPDPASGARLQVSGPVGQEQIKVFYSSKPLTIFADLGANGAGMFRSVDGGMEAVSRSLEEARSLGTKISIKTLTLTTVDSLPAAPPVAAAPTAKPAPVEQAAKQPVESTKPAVTPKPKPVKKPETVVEKPKKVAPKPVEQATQQPPKKYKIVTNLAPGQELAADELQLIGPADTTSSTKPTQYKQPTTQYKQPAQTSQTKMPKLPMPQIKMPQFKLPGGFSIKMPQLNLGRSAEPGEAAGAGEEIEVANADTPVCTALLDKLNTAVAAKDITAAAAEADTIAVSADCGQFQVNAQRRVAALRLSAAQEMMAANQPVADYEPLLIAADSPQVLWQASATLGEIYFSARRFADAAADYQQAIEIIKNETRTPKAPPAETISDLIQRAAQARILAANPTSDHPEGSFVPAEKDHRSGVLGGIYSENVRGIVPVSIPVPITFDFNKSSFTSIGTEAAQELLEALKEQKPGRVILIGHTDRRGGDDYNQKLSERRAQAVADFLKSHGIDASIDAEGRGASEPVDVTATANLTEDDVDALNRRVEWRRE